MQVQDREKLRALLEKEIEAQGVKIGWGSIGKTRKDIHVLTTKYVRYKDCKVAMLPEGNILICAIDGCYNVMRSDNLCITHIKDVNKLPNRICISKEICTTQANFNYEGEPPLYCKKHRPDTKMIDVKNIKCESQGCKKQPGFGYPGERARWCYDHKEKDAKDLNHKICIGKDCTTRASYGKLGGKVQYCIEHKQKGDVRLDGKLCSENGCGTQAVFGYKDQKERYCKNHSKEDMKDLANKICLFPGCDIYPIYGYIGGKRDYCTMHKNSLMIDLRNQKCMYANCGIQASFALPGERSIYCHDHKLENMINVKSKRCIQLDCNILATFGFPDKKPIYCKEHKIEGTNDVKHVKCSFPECNLRPSHGYLFSKTDIHCSEHSTKNEFCQSKREPLCFVVNCNNIANYICQNDYKLLNPKYCTQHKSDSDIELIYKPCTECPLTLYIPSDKDVCAECGNYRYKFCSEKEKRVKDFLLANNIKHIHNKPVHEKGSLYRPDFLLDCKFGKLIIECDEYQHQRGRYTKEDEIKRMKVIYNDIQIIKPKSKVLFIRYNPDGYKGDQYSTTERLEYLLDLINYFIELPKLNHQLGVLYLFYSGFDSKPEIQNIRL